MFKMWKLKTTASNNVKDLISDFLIGLNALGVSEEPIDNEKFNISAIFPIETQLEPVIDKIKKYMEFLENQFNNIYTDGITVEQIDRSSWEIWKSVLKTVKASKKIVISPPWEKYEPKDQETSIVINPSMAFGTGHHETTKLCIQFIEALAEKNKFRSILDAGCGSAILSIAAIKLGFKEAIAFDIDPVAVKEAKENLIRNSVWDQIKIFCGYIESVKNKFHIIVANISVEAILLMKHSLKSKLKKDGFLILSGIPTMRKEETITGIKSVGFSIVQEKVDGEWVALLFRP